MTNRVQYHHPRDGQYSLAYVARDRGDFTTSDENAMVERYDFGTEFFVLYTAEGPSGTIDEVDGEFEDALDAMSPEIRVITLRLLQIFEGIIEATELEDGEAMEIYKQIEVEKIPDAISHVEWDRSAVDVAAQLMSTLILAHALPNANHRTSIGLAEWYLESAASGFSLPTLATTDYDWKDWVDEYIIESKRLITIRRNTTAFSLLEEWGCEIVERKGGIEIRLSEYNLDLPGSEAFQYYAERHTELCRGFIVESVERAEHDELLQIDGPALSEFADYLEQTA